MYRDLRSGSALLIVLGMLSFMVVSAIGFSVFMRQNRLPSSFVRRNTTSNHLLKASLARAMNELDSAIGNNPFPGRVDSANSNSISPNLLKGTKDTWYIGDCWRGRVFVGQASKNSANINVSTDNNKNILVPYEDTVATLSMEGLAYLPPCLVNDVRYFSRYTPTARWHRLGYDAGRFAYTAVNVSDYFDLNKIHGAFARTFSPTNRVSLAYMFTDEKGNFKQSGADEYQKMLDESESFVSLADFNLVMAKNGDMSSQISKFGFGSSYGEYAKGDGEVLRYYGSNYSLNSKTNDNIVAKSTFVTDSYSPATMIEENLLDLNDEKNQPFSEALLKKDSPQISEIYEDFEKKNRPFAKQINDLTKGIMGVGLAANLYDYLDEDNTPASLALPSVEAIPMIAGIKVSGLDNVKAVFTRKVEGIDPSQNPLGPEGPKDVVAKYYLKFEGVENLKFDVETIFPFQNAKPDPCTVNVAAQIIWGPSDSLAQRGSKDELSTTDLVVQGLFTEKNKSTAEGMDEFNRYVFKEGSTSCSHSENPKSLENVIAKSTVTCDKSTKESSIPFAVITEHWSCQIKERVAKWTFLGSDMINGDDVKGLIGSNRETTKTAGNYIPYLVFRVAIKSGNKTYDLVPACVWDDALNMSKTVDDEANGYADGHRVAFVIKASDGDILDYSKESLQSTTGISQLVGNAKAPNLVYNFNKTEFVCPDPRWNHNVANWKSTSNVSTEIESAFNGTGGSDSDCFQSVSNQLWLNSIAELAFLPRTTAFKSDGRTLSGTMSMNGNPDTSNFGKSLPLTKEIAEARGEQHWLCDSEIGDEHSLEGLFADGTEGFRINPYSDDANIFLAAVAYSPRDWATATPLENDEPPDFDPNDTLLEMEDAKEISKLMQKGFANNRDGDWVKAFNKLDWGFAGGNDIFEDMELTSADKKFLFGFWKGCFDVRQQLFIIFVRAEPSISGSSSKTAGKGGRAVAVVWRDPNPPLEDEDKSPREDKTLKPHKMRVLFYKTLE